MCAPYYSKNYSHYFMPVLRPFICVCRGIHLLTVVGVDQGKTVNQALIWIVLDSFRREPRVAKRAVWVENTHSWKQTTSLRKQNKKVFEAWSSTTDVSLGHRAAPSSSPIYSQQSVSHVTVSMSGNGQAWLVQGNASWCVFGEESEGQMASRNTEQTQNKTHATNTPTRLAFITQHPRDRLLSFGGGPATREEISLRTLKTNIAKRRHTHEDFFFFVMQSKKEAATQAICSFEYSSTCCKTRP